MDNLLYLLPVLACPVGMGLMMLFMMRPGHKQADQAPATDQEIQQLRAEVADLRAGMNQDAAPHDADRVSAPDRTA